MCHVSGSDDYHLSNQLNNMYPLFSNRQMCKQINLQEVSEGGGIIAEMNFQF